MTDDAPNNGPKTSLEDLTALVRRAQLPMSAAQIAELHGGAWVYVERMIARVTGDGIERFAEPAHIFKPDAQ